MKIPSRNLVEPTLTEPLRNPYKTLPFMIKPLCAGLKVWLKSSCRISCKLSFPRSPKKESNPKA